MTMRRPLMTRFFVLVLAISMQSGFVMGQRRAPREVILERNIRAEMNFLAGDAMQGRGSATGFERIAAEYIAAQFRQVGLEPAGDQDASGAPGFVQRVPLQSLKYKEAPALTATTGGATHRWEHGRDLLVSLMRGSQVSGDLQIINADETPARGAFVVVRTPSDATRQSRQDITRRARTAGAVAIALLENEANKQMRESGKARMPELPPRFSNEGASARDNGFAAITLRPEAFAELSAIPPGARIDFGAPVQADEAAATWNAVGMIRGADPTLSRQAIFLSAHLDHLGVADEGAGGDSIFNGADDDASGCISVMELARVLAAGPRPKRTIYFVCFGSEERGGWGAQYFVAHAPVPLDMMVADLNFEMLGRPDAKVAANTLWFTGFDRSNLGAELARRGARLVADPHPEQNFFQRSDNYTLALRGVVAHTVSSFGLHADYHRPSDEAAKIDFVFMTSAISSLVAPVRWLANTSFRPHWQPGKAPTR